jgi:hypothetical protein
LSTAGGVQPPTYAAGGAKRADFFSDMFSSVVPPHSNKRFIGHKVRNIVVFLSR